jgi:NTE family protein
MNQTLPSPLDFTSTNAFDQPRAAAGGARALVLGGGGSSGNAWSIGVVAGLLDAGLDVTEADLVIGTSAGATTAVQILGASPTELLAATLAWAPPARSDPTGSGRGSEANRPVIDHLERTNTIIAASEDAADMRRRMGAAALELEAISDRSGRARWRATVAARLPIQDWPERPLLITAVDTQNGEPVVFDRQSGVDLVDAVAASCSSGPAYRIGDGSFIDGGYRRNENADLAAGYQRVLVLSPFGGQSRHPREWGMQLAAQVGELRVCGSTVETIIPDAGSVQMFGANAMDLSLRPAAAHAGYDQGRALAEPLLERWG